MERTSITFLLLGLALAGCVGTISDSATRDAERRARAAFAECNTELRNGVLKSYSQAADCARPKVLAAYQENGYPNMDLIELDLYARGLGARRVDAGDTTPSAVNRDIAELDRRIAAEEQRRLDARRATSGGAPPVPLAQLMAGLDALTTTSAPLPPPGKNCINVGSFTHCE